MMMRILAKLRLIGRDSRGTMAIETAIVAPVLIILSAGAFEASRMVARQGELQSAAGEAASIIRVATPDTQAEMDTIEDVVEASTGLADNKVTLSRVFRCGTDAAYVASAANCADENTMTTYVNILISDSYAPAWTHFGFGSSLTYNVERTVQIS